MLNPQENRISLETRKSGSDQSKCSSRVMQEKDGLLECTVRITKPVREPLILSINTSAAFVKCGNKKDADDNEGS